MGEEVRVWTYGFYAGRQPLYDEALADPQRLLKFLKSEGLDYAVLLAEYSPITGTICPNEQVAEFCKGSDCLIPFASINPHLCPRPADYLEELVVAKGFKGIKLYPTYQHFYPHEAHLYPLYTKAEELKIPVMIHTGSSVFPGAKLKYGDPLFIDEIAVDFPRLTIIQVHGGRGFWYDKAFFLASRHKNVYIDIAGLPPANLLKYFPEFERNQDKFLFGSDWPGVPGIAGNIEAVRKLPISEECKRKVLGENACRLLKLEA
jgi:predicted TIM-barrel fold metal-dependent hydrolase